MVGNLWEEVHLLHGPQLLLSENPLPRPGLGQLVQACEVVSHALKPALQVSDFLLRFCQAALLRSGLLYWVAFLSQSISFASKKATISSSSSSASLLSFLSFLHLEAVVACDASIRPARLSPERERVRET